MGSLWIFMVAFLRFAGDVKTKWMFWISTRKSEVAGNGNYVYIHCVLCRELGTFFSLTSHQGYILRYYNLL